MKIYNHQLECGCLIADDTGTKKHPDGNAGLIPCYAEYGDMTKKKDREHLELHNKCINDFFGKKKVKKTEPIVKEIKKDIYKKIKKFILKELFNHRKAKEGLISINNQFLNDANRMLLEWSESDLSYLDLCIKRKGFVNKLTTQLEQGLKDIIDGNVISEKEFKKRYCPHPYFHYDKKGNKTCTVCNEILKKTKRNYVKKDLIEFVKRIKKQTKEGMDKHLCDHLLWLVEEDYKED